MLSLITITSISTVTAAVNMLYIYILYVKESLVISQLEEDESEEDSEDF